MKHNNTTTREIAQHIFTGSTAMVEIGVMVIMLFRVMNFSLEPYADGIISINSCIIILSAVMSYLS